MTEQELKTAAWDYRMTYGYPETQEEMEKMAECFYELGQQSVLGKKNVLMKAIEVEVLDFSLGGNHPHLNIPLSHLKYHSGDRVRVIIMKEQ